MLIEEPRLSDWCAMGLLIVAVSVLASACATDPISEQVKRGRYLEAAALCRDVTVAGSRGACEKARLGAIQTRLANLERLRREGHPASDLPSLAELDQLLRLVEAGPPAKDSPLARGVADDVVRAKEALAADSHALISQPLAAESYWEKRIPFLQYPQLRELLVVSVGEVRTSGQQICARLSERPGSPTWAELVRRYCVHFGEKGPTLSRIHAQAEVNVRAKGLSPEQEDIIRQRLVRMLAETRWSKSPVPAAVRVTVEGTYASVQTDQTVVLHGAYTEYHLAYPVMPLGTGTLMVLPQTVDYPYEARDHWRRYEANLRISVDFAGAATPMASAFRKGESLRGRDHHVTFEPSGIHPVHTTLPSADNWLDMEFGAFAAELGAALDEHWLQTYCKASTYTNDRAARCLLGGETSEQVLTTIAKSLGDDVKAVARLASHQDAP